MEQIATNEHRQACKQRASQQIRLGIKNRKTKKKVRQYGLKCGDSITRSRREIFLANILVEEHVSVLLKLFAQVKKKNGEEYQPEHMAVTGDSLENCGKVYCRLTAASKF